MKLLMLADQHRRGAAGRPPDPCGRALPASTRSGAAWGTLPAVDSPERFVRGQALKTLAIIARKGGTGKTTLAVHLAAAAHASGYSTLLADTDRQHSAVEWRRMRQQAQPVVEAVKPGALFARQQDAARAPASTC